MTYTALLATNEDGSPVELSYEQRADHTYMVGITGKGKSTLMAQLALADMNHPDRPGLCVLDPHGTLVEDILLRVPEHRLDDVILIDPADPDFPFAFNLFAPMPNQVELDRYASELIGVFEATFGDEWRQVSDTMRNLTLTLLGRNSEGNLPNTDVPAIPAMDEIPHLLNLERIPEDQVKRNYWNQDRVKYRELFYDGLQDAGLINVLEFWKRMYDQLTPRLKMGTVQLLVERVNRFLGNPLMARTLAQTQNKLDFDEVLNNGRILLVNLSKSQLGEENSRFLGSVILARLTAAIFKRDPRRPDQIRRFHVIIDEFHNLITSSFPKLFTDGRKFGVDVVVAHQKRGENLWAERTTAAAGNLICFELHGGDQRELAGEFDLLPEPSEAEFRPIMEQGMEQGGKLSREPAMLDPRPTTEELDKLTSILDAQGEIHEDFQIVSNDTVIEILRTLMNLRVPMESDHWREKVNQGTGPLVAFMRPSGVVSGAPGPPGDFIIFSSEECTWRQASEEPLGRTVASPEEFGPTAELIASVFQPEFRDYLETTVRPRMLERARAWDDEYSRRKRRLEFFAENYTQVQDYSGLEDKNLYQKIPGRLRLFSDVQLELANQLAHLGKYKAMFKLSNEEETNRVGTTLPLPEPTLTDEQLASIRDRTRKEHCRPRAEVDKELLRRYQARLRSVGYTDWETGKPLPDIPLYSSDDAEADDD